jgi:hypothetical protein
MYVCLYVCKYTMCLGEWMGGHGSYVFHSVTKCTYVPSTIAEVTNRIKTWRDSNPQSFLPNADTVRASRLNCISRDRCYDFLNIFVENFCIKIGVFDPKLS